MRRRRVAVLYSHALFGRGIAELLHADKRFRVVCLESSLEDAAEQLRDLQPHVIVVEGSDEDPLIHDVVRGLPAALFIVVRMNDNVMDVYYRRQAVAACPEDLVEVIRHGIGVRAHAETAAAG